MPVLLQGSCHCGAVHYTVQSHTPVPYQLCVCSICRKVGGVGGSIGLGAVADTLKVTQGQDRIRVYHAVLDRDTPYETTATSERHFCSVCSAMLWVFDSRWPELLHPFVSSVDFPELEAPREMVVVQMCSKPDYVRLLDGRKHVYKEFGPDSVEDWHKKHGKYVP